MLTLTYRLMQTIQQVTGGWQCSWEQYVNNSDTLGSSQLLRQRTILAHYAAINTATVTPQHRALAPGQRLHRTQDKHNGSPPNHTHTHTHTQYLMAIGPSCRARPHSKCQGHGVISHSTLCRRVRNPTPCTFWHGVTCVSARVTHDHSLKISRDIRTCTQCRGEVTLMSSRVW